jgi:hypothetical protein
VAFRDTFELTVVVDGKTYVIVVTDDATTYAISLEYQSDISMDGVYLIAKQEGAHVDNNNYEGGNGTAAQYYIQALDEKPSTINAGTFYAVYWGVQPNPYDASKQVTIYLATSSNGPVDANGLINNGGAGYTYYYNGETVNGYNISINSQASPATVTIGNVGPVTYSAHIDFYEAWATSANTTASLVSGQTLTATIGSDVYAASITGTGDLTFTKDNATATLPDGELTWKLNNNAIVSGTTMIGRPAAAASSRPASSVSTATAPRSFACSAYAAPWARTPGMPM